MSCKWGKCSSLYSIPTLLRILMLRWVKHLIHYCDVVLHVKSTLVLCVYYGYFYTWSYRSVLHICPPFWHLSASRKCREGGGLYVGSNFYLVNTSPLPVPRLDIDIGTLYYYKLIEASSTPVCFCFSCPPETQIPFGQDRLTEVGHSVDSSIFQSLRGFVLSMCCSIDTIHEHACDSRWVVLWTLASFWHSHSITETLNLTVWEYFDERSCCYFW